MAMICVYGGECNGCCECLNEDQLICEWCGMDITDEEYDEYNGRCGDCYNC